MSDIFISYSNQDRERARQLAQAFEAQGWSVFWDRSIPAGKSWRSYIGKALDDARCVVVAWSSNSIGSEWVQEEADDARQRNVLVPTLLETVTPPIGFRGIQAADLSEWKGEPDSDALTALIRAIQGLLAPTPASDPIVASADEASPSAPDNNAGTIEPQAPGLDRTDDAQPEDREPVQSKRRILPIMTALGAVVVGTVAWQIFSPSGVDSISTLRSRPATNGPARSPTEPTTPQPEPTIHSFVAEPDFVQRGDKVSLRWQIDDASAVRLDGIGSVDPSLPFVDAPNVTTTYRLIATNAAGTASATATVVVTTPEAIADSEPELETVTVSRPAFPTLEGADLAEVASTPRLDDVWLRGGLFGTYFGGRVRPVSIQESGDAYAVEFTGPFGNDCRLESDSAGNPHRLSNCRNESTHGTPPGPVTLRCLTLTGAGEVVCAKPVGGAIEYPSIARKLN